MKIVVSLVLWLATSAVSAQDTPVDIAKSELPKSAPCTVCTVNGSAHGDEKPVAGVRYKGKSFYFCNSKEVETFKKDPDGYLPPVLPRAAPAFSLKNLAGESVSLAGLRGKVVLVDYWATWCAPCVATMPEMQRLYEQYGSSGLTVLGVSIDEDGEKKVRPFIAKRKYTYPILLDDQSSWKSFGVKAIPALFLIDKEGQIVKQWVGKPDKKDVDAAVKALLK